MDKKEEVHLNPKWRGVMSEIIAGKKDLLEENLTNLIGKNLECVNINISGKVVWVNPGVFIIIETQNGDVRIDINDGITGLEVFKVDDTVEDLPISGAFIDLDEMKLIFVFEGEDSKKSSQSNNSKGEFVDTYV